MSGRIGKVIVATAIGADGAEIVLPFLPGVKHPWGPVEYLTIVFCAIGVGLVFGLKRD